jgi:hypothetical protein
MPRPDLVSLFLGPLSRLGIPYAATGAFAAVFYGHPRITHDVDLVAEFSLQREWALVEQPLNEGP